MSDDEYAIKYKRFCDLVCQRGTPQETPDTRFDILRMYGELQSELAAARQRIAWFETASNASSIQPNATLLQQIAELNSALADAEKDAADLYNSMGSIIEGQYLSPDIHKAYRNHEARIGGLGVGND